jgi:hypothetical protein
VILTVAFIVLQWYSGARNRMSKLAPEHLLSRKGSSRPATLGESCWALHADCTVADHNEARARTLKMDAKEPLDLKRGIRASRTDADNC